jgi:1-aminocyclopropane-1-carboxylate deaminase/D-cysteine desulfhydrase-like pyridoxal-dependent ACC family enzyme
VKNSSARFAVSPIVAMTLHMWSSGVVVRVQEKEMDLRFDYVIVCTVTGSTHAGMVVGFAPTGGSEM